MTAEPEAVRQVFASTGDDLRDELMTLLVAGHETTATVLARTPERVTRHPDVLARLQADPEDGAHLDAVVTETLRLPPVAPSVVRRLRVPMEFGGGIRRCLGASFALFEMKAVTRRAITFAPAGGGRIRLAPA